MAPMLPAAHAHGAPSLSGDVPSLMPTPTPHRAPGSLDPQEDEHPSPPQPTGGAPADRPRPRLALETTLLLHGVPRHEALALHARLAAEISARGAEPALVGVLAGRPIVGMSGGDLAALLAHDHVPKVNTATLGLTLHRRGHGATTVSATAELAARAGVRVFATGGIGGVHRELSQRPDISADLAALARFPVAVVASGCKSFLDPPATRELLESLGVPVIGYRTDRFPAFYCADGHAGVDARFDDPADLAHYLDAELSRTRRGVLVCVPPPADSAIDPARFEGWLTQARDQTPHASGRDLTPAILQALHRVSGGATLRTNLDLALNNARVGADLAVALARRGA